MYSCLYVCMHIYIYIYIYIYWYILVYMHMSMYMYTFIYIYIYIPVSPRSLKPPNPTFGLRPSVEFGGLGLFKGH